MYTDCPGCQRQFHIYAAQIAAARGVVKCGFCGEQFNALERLHDKPMVRGKPEDQPGRQQRPLPEPDFIIPDANSKPVPEQLATNAGSSPRPPESESDRIAIASVDSGQVTKADAGVSNDSENSPALAAQAGSADAQPDFTGEAAAALSGLSHSTNFDFPMESIEPARKPGWLSRLLWALGILLLMLFATTQIIWFNRDAIMRRYPDTVPWFNRLCTSIDCSAIRHRDLAAIQLLNRDVREHPRYQNALLVNATMSNQSQTIQPYPVVQLNLFDTDGNLLAYRQFQPQEYLDESINLAQGMTPKLPVHFVLEVLDSAAGAVSFEFEFH
ncbi:MAG: hypothetical protein HW386_261 [Gammaproteobacteria bacterium]|nr:hypothetical protein [Gammaproteobacteria bacterium]